MRCRLTAKRLLGDFSVSPSISFRSYWPGSSLENLSCKATALPEPIVEPIHEFSGGLFGLFGSNTKRTFAFLLHPQVYLTELNKK